MSGAAASSRPTAVVAGALAQRPGIGGHAWVFLNWLSGLRGAGWDVVFVDRLEPGMLDDPAAPVEQSRQWEWLLGVMEAAGLEDSFALLYDGGRACFGLGRADLLERCRRAPVLFNVMGYLDDEELLGAVGRRVFVDIDPGFPQMWRALGWHDAFAGHDAVVTVGLRLGRPGCTVPDCGLDWVPTLPPVDLDRWPSTDAVHAGTGGPPRVTSVCTWRGPFGPIDYEGVRYGLRAHELRRFAALPSLIPNAHMELALDIDDADARDREHLLAGGWHLVEPGRVAGDPSSYRRYIQGSAAEVMVAKEMYVRSGGGWFSDRSACYLASGRPVVAQETGFGDVLPTGEGLLRFTDPEEAAAALAEVLGNRTRHAKAARDLAVDCLDAPKVLAALLCRLGVA
jgi:hypothetical protein